MNEEFGTNVLVGYNSWFAVRDMRVAARRCVMPLLLMLSEQEDECANGVGGVAH